MDPWERRFECPPKSNSVTRAEFLHQARALRNLPPAIQKANNWLFDCGWWIVKLMHTNYLTEETYDHRGGKIPTPIEVRDLCDRLFRRKDTNDLRPADVVIMRYDNVPRHVALVIPHPYRKLGIMHYSLMNQCLVEEGIDLSIQFRIIYAYNIPGLAD